MTNNNFKSKSRVQIITLIPILLLLVLFAACKNDSNTKKIKKSPPLKIMEYQKEKFKQNTHQIGDTIYLLQKDSTQLSKEKVIYIIDGVKQPNDFDFSSLDSKTIDSINVFKDNELMRKYISNPEEYSGVIYIKTKK